MKHLQNVTIQRTLKSALACILALVVWSAWMVLPAYAQGPPDYYVDKEATGGANNGSSWGDAYTDLQTALGSVTAGDEIWVATGVYTPGVSVNDSFNLPPGVALYGGFVATETMRSQRNFTTNLTILSGDIGGDDTDTDGNNIAEDTGDIQNNNSIHVVYVDGTGGTVITGSTILDGFTITAGQADESGVPSNIQGGGFYCDGSGFGNECSPTLANVTLAGNLATVQGGAMYNNGNSGASSPTLTNVTFTGNAVASLDGGAMVNDGASGGISSPQLTNVTFVGNAASGSGGAMYNFGQSGTSSPQLVNVIFSGNSAGFGGAMVNTGNSGISSPQLTNVTFSGNLADGGGAMYNDNSLPNMTNVILWGNKSNNNQGHQLYNSFASPVLSYTLIQNGANDIFNDSSTVTYGPGMVSSDPLFVAPITATVAPTTTGDYRLAALSPAIDAGLNSAITLTTDLDGNHRFYDDGVIDTGSGSPPLVDLGAFERQINSCPVTSILYVDQTATGGNNGDSWANALTDLQDALILAGACAGLDEVWVATGVYTPGVSVGDSFNLPPGVTLYGGFAATETLRSQRNFTANVTILSGDIDGNDTNSDGNNIAEDTGDIQGNNSNHVVYANGSGGTVITESTALDGFTITAGQASGDGGGGFFCAGDGSGSQCSPTLANITFSGNSATSGGAMYNAGFAGTSSPQLTNVTFVGNSANNGGAMYNDGASSGISDPRLTNVIFSGNAASTSGGAMYNAGFADGTSSPILINVTLAGNNGGTGGGAMYNNASSPQLTNVIVWGNTAGTGNQLYNNQASPVLSYTLIQNGANDIFNDSSSTVTYGPGVVISDPLFVAPIVATDAPTSAGNYRLSSASPGIDAGLNSAIALLTDLDGNPRIISTVDLGAYESSCPGNNPIYVDKDATGGNNGDSWANALTDLQDGLTLARACTGLDEIWVATGIYTPGATTGDTFSLVPGVAMYGGFAATETLRSQRNFTANVTILSGDIGGDDTNTDGNNIAETWNDIVGSNSDHVVYAGGSGGTVITESTALDGFTITAGQADGGFPDNSGGGFYCDGSGSGSLCSPSLTNVTFSGNAANNGGAMYNHGASSGSSSPQLTNVIFSGNAAFGFGIGGAMYNADSNPTLSNVTFSGNAAGEGGATTLIRTRR
jgi:hypothetical protein